MADFNADGKTDVLWQHFTSGALAVWMMNGITMTDVVSLSHNFAFDPRWRVRAVTDINRDGKPDLIIQHPVDGHIAAWFLNGTTLIDGSLLTPGTLSPSWQIRGAGDFNADGKPDLVFEDSDGSIAVWYMNGTTLIDAFYTNPRFISSIGDRNWILSGVGDINSDGKPDLILHHIYDGFAGAWLMNGLNQLDGSLFNPGAVADANWRIVGPR
jgi:hypothetical protein